MSKKDSDKYCNLKLHSSGLLQLKSGCVWGGTKQDKTKNTRHYREECKREPYQKPKKEGYSSTALHLDLSFLAAEKKRKLNMKSKW